MDDIQYTSMQPQHLRHIVSLHEECFPGYYLTELGTSFLRAMYGWYVRNPEAIAHVALDAEGNVVGFVVGTADAVSYQRSLIREKWRPMLAALCQRLLAKPQGTLRLIRERTDLMRPALGTILASRSSELDRAGVNSEQGVATASLVSIGIKPSARRSGLGRTLSEIFLHQARQRGCERVTLSVREDNVEARRFYESMGWEEGRRSSRPYHGSISIIYEKTLGSDQKVRGTR